MNGRQELKRNILLCGESDGTVFKRTFTIVKKLSEGASSVCYEAYYGKSGRGVLKEFYPQDDYALERNENSQLIHSSEFGDAYERFLRAEREYIEPYEMLLAAKQSGVSQDLATFIPSFEIYHGCDEESNLIGTTYIWTPETKLETFDTVCDSIHKHPTVSPEHKLVTVLLAIESLAKCICALHSSDMLHRDIKPSNFGFVKRGSEVLTQTLSMFDIDSICSVFGSITDVVGTKGYMEPESGYELPSNQTDIYSIGATLFNAIIVSDETKSSGYLYRNEYYDQLHEMVDNSRLIRASEANAHPRLRNILATILKKCLCERTYRYANCEELIDDLERALYYSLPSDIARRKLSGENWILADIEKSLDVNKEKNSFLSLQYHLYEHPLYECSKEGEKEINVLVIGFGNYGQKFMDLCLQAGQIRDKRLDVTVITDDVTDKTIYLSERPELAEFFNIDNSLLAQQDSYGNITFEASRLERDDKSENANIMKNIIHKHYNNKHLHCVFIALGDDELNYFAARACECVVEEKTSITYICEENNSSCEKANLFYPLYINKDIRTHHLYSEIERMAFNTHLIWEKNLNTDYKTVKAEYRKPYNHDSCVSSVLSLKYKLYSMGIALETTSFNNAARLFHQKLSGKNSRKLRNELIWIEHRRWVTEKLCLGWRRIRNLEDCANGMTKDERHKRHICIVKSRPDQKLATEYTTNENHRKWDTASDAELSQLDELDLMSVKLHRMFARKAQMAKGHNLLSENSIASIRSSLESNMRAMVAFQEWYTCLKDIWNGDDEKIHLQKGLKERFLKATDEMSYENKTSIRGQVKALEATFYPVFASMEYRNWKQDDVAFVDNIPFVLTYTENAYLIIPFSTGDNTSIFGNVATATVVNPARIIYLYLVENKQDVRELKNAVLCVTEYMQKKQLKAAVEFVLAYHGGATDFLREDIEKDIIERGKGRIRQVKHIVANELNLLSVDLENYLKQRSQNKSFFAVEENETKLSAVLKAMGLYNLFPSYQYDLNSMKFAVVNNCDMLKSIRKAPYITVADMTSFNRSSSVSSNQPEFFTEYKELWNKYRERSGLWKQLCELLSEYAEKNDILVTFKKKNSLEKDKDIKEYHYIVPFDCAKSCARIIRFLKKHNILEPESCINGYTTASCEIVIVDRCGYRAGYDKLFSNIYALMLTNDISIYLNARSHEAVVSFDNLAVSGVQIPANRGSDITHLMQYFRDKGYVINLSVNSEGKMSFVYATKQIKELLTTAGKMLEIYTYHKAKEVGRFNDVVSSYEVIYGSKGEIKNEFDCILTKGFKTLFVECKARSDIEQDYYFKLSSLAEQFGINATAVLIADTREKDNHDNAPLNTMQRERGKMMNVITIWKPDEINNIGHTLLKVINGIYAIEED